MMGGGRPGMGAGTGAALGLGGGLLGGMMLGSAMNGLGHHGGDTTIINNYETVTPLTCPRGPRVLLEVC